MMNELCKKCIHKDVSANQFPCQQCTFDIIKQHGIPSIYFYGMDKMWHGFGDMDILRTFKGEYKKEDVEYVDTLPSNISFIIKK